ncbi:hypothetical protein [Halomonas huangheensis]|uniref:Uncharacterized protein n=1 Tax=Halomonas huangheensis TaxID=1178482 RepID=W1N1X4_9GAMM|nr:hypothetical protein [Halomonas huangheensis]ERL49489.1 hypothetical protein BJB45_06830 [Halomonas huangheensis]
MSRSPKISQAVITLFGIGLIIGAGYLSWIILARLLAFLESANPSVSAAVVGSMATVLVGVGGALYTQAQIKKREIEEAHRARKVELYKGFLDMVAKMTAENNEDVSLEPPSPQELVDFMLELKTNIVLWGSPKVINAQLNFQKVSESGGNVLFAVDELYKAIREDIGLSNRGLNKRQLVKMYLRDPSELDAMSASNKALQQTSR